MPIVATTYPSSPTTLPAPQQVLPVSASGVFLLLIVCAAVIAAARFTRVVRPGAIAGPERVPTGSGAWAMVLVMAGGMFTSLACQAVYLRFRMQQLEGPASGKSAAFDISLLTGADFAILSVAPILAFVLTLIGDLSVGSRTLERLGFGPGRLRTGVLPGLIGVAFVLPVMYAVTVLTEQLYQVLKFEHPREHELLRAMGDSNNVVVRLALIIGAVIVAPLFEELIFRGHLQSLLRALFALFGKQKDPGPDPLTPPADSARTPVNSVLSYQPYPSPLPPLSSTRPSPLAGWASIVATSAVFALIHERWTWPVIFLLALCLGYAYERTQNLWVPIIIHAGFNAASTIAFLMMSG